MNKFKRFMKNTKAISPIFATLILIAIAVIAGVVVYMFTSGFLATSTTNTNTPQEKVAVQGIDVVGQTVYAQNMGSADVILTSALIKDSNGNVVTNVDLGTTDTPLTIGPSAIANVDISGIDNAKMSSGSSYTVTLVSAKGGSFVSSSFVAP